MNWAVEEEKGSNNKLAEAFIATTEQSTLGSPLCLDYISLYNFSAEIETSYQIGAILNQRYLSTKAFIVAESDYYQGIADGFSSNNRVLLG